MIDSNILLDHFSGDYSIRGTALSWLQSFFSDQMQYSTDGAEQSVLVNCTSGVPQGSVLSPLLFTMYMTPVVNVVSGTHPAPS